VRTKKFRNEVLDQGKRSRTRALLMDAAVTVFAKKGVEATAVSDVTELAELSNGSFYYHFRDKAELVDTVAHAIAASLVSETDDAIRSVVDGVERVALATQYFIKLAAAEPEWGWLVVQALSDMGTFHDQISRGIRKDVAIAVKQGAITVEVTDMLFTCLLAVVGVAVRERLERPNAPDIEAKAAEFNLRMLGVAPEVARRLPSEVVTRHSVRPGAQRVSLRRKPTKGKRIARNEEASKRGA
jgi:AcrR family transcriptional regulator